MGNKNKKALFWGVDDGHAEIKIAMSNGRRFALPSRAAAGLLNIISIDGESPDTFQYNAPDGTYVLGDVDRADPTNFDDYPTSSLNRVLVSHALRMAGSKGSPVNICSGLPVKKFYRGKKPNVSLVSAKKESLLLNNITSEDGCKLSTVIGHEVISEGISAWIDYVVRPNKTTGELEPNRDLVRKKIAIVDIGGRTTDVAVIRDWNLDMSRSSTIDVGMLAVYEGIREGVREDYEVELNDTQVANAAKKGVVRLWGQSHEIKHIVKEAREVAVSHIKMEVLRRLGKGADLDKVILVGGGVLALNPLLDGWFPHQHVGPEPAFSNARGMQKYCEMVLGD